MIPERASARLWNKSTDPRNLGEVVDRVRTCGEGISKSIGAQVRIQHDFPVFEESVPNLSLIRKVSGNFDRLGIPYESA